MEEKKLVLTASVTGTLSSKDGRDPEAYKITVVYSDGSKTVFQKTYQDFVDLQVTVYDLLKKKGGYSKKTAKSLVTSLPELNLSLSKMIFKESDLKKMGRLDEFIKELLILPTVIRESESIMNFFGALKPQQETSERLEKEDVLSARDPINWKAEDQKPRSKKILTLPGKRRAFSADERAIKANSPTLSSRPGLKKKAFSVGVGIADMVKENLNSIANAYQTEHSQSTGVPPRSSLEQNKQQSRSNEISRRSENSGDAEIVETGVEEPCIQSVSIRSGKESPKRTKYVAISSFVAEQSGEVSLEDGEEVDVLEKKSSGWWYVRKEFGEGWAPSSYLAPAQVSRSRSPETLSQSQDVDSREKSSPINEKLDALPEGPTEEEEERESYRQERKKSLPGTSVTELEEKTSTVMNRRVKFVTVEGIQKRKNPEKNYVYILKVVWLDGSINIIYRQCSDFFFLQENLKKEFPTAHGKEIPVLKGRKFSENCQFGFKDGTCKRRQLLAQFFHDLINGPDNVSTCEAVMVFCKARPSDVRPHTQSSKTDIKTINRDDDDDDDVNVKISGPVVFEQYIVTADYKKKDTSDISLTAGDTVDVIEKHDLGWWLVDRDGELGFAPASHLEPKDGGSEIITSNTFAPGKDEVYQSVHSYQAKAEDELSFDVGVMLKVVEKTLDGWWLVRYQGEEGWAPAMFLRRIASDDSSTPMSGKIIDLDMVSFNGDSGDGCKKRTRSPPTRRSMVQRSTRITSKQNTNPQLSEVPIPEEQDPSTSAKKNGRPGSVSATTLTTPPENEKKFTQGDVDRRSPRGWNSSSSNSFSSFTSDVPASGESTSPIKKYATLPCQGHVDERIVHSAQSPVIPRSNSFTTVAEYDKKLESAENGIPPTGKSPASERRSPRIPRSPIPTPRNISRTSESSSMSSSQSSIHDLRESGSEKEHENGYDYRNSPESPRCKVTSEIQSYNGSQKENDNKLYRAMYTYISQGKKEITFNEGDVVEVLHRSDNGWWLLGRNDELGWGPSNFLEPVHN